MIYGTPKQVKEDYVRLLDLFADDGGEYIAGTDSNHPFPPETPLRNLIALYEAYLENEHK